DSCVHPAICGLKIVLGNEKSVSYITFSSSVYIFGFSFSKTSRQAPPALPVRREEISALVTTTFPLEVLTMITPSLQPSKKDSSQKCLVSADKGRWKLITSALLFTSAQSVIFTKSKPSEGSKLYLS